MAAETVDEEKAENVTEELAETEIVTVKMAETKEVVKKKVQNCLKLLKMGLKSNNRLKWT